MSRLSAFARTPRGILATVVVALLVIGGGVGAGVALADRSDSTVRATTKASPTPAASSSGQEAKGVHGKIVTASPDGLTLREGDGTVLTVLITAKTRFGSKKRPATAADLVPGARVTVIGSLSGTTVSARRIVPAKPRAATPGPSAAPTVSTSPTI
jgi:hypothetical protein